MLTAAGGGSKQVTLQCCLAALAGSDGCAGAFCQECRPVPNVFGAACLPRARQHAATARLCYLLGEMYCHWS